MLFYRSSASGQTLDFWITRDIQTGTVAPVVDSYFADSSCGTSAGWLKPPATKNFVYRNFDRVIYARDLEASRTFNSVRRGTTGACDVINETFAAYVTANVTATIPSSIPAPLKLVPAE